MKMKTLVRLEGRRTNAGTRSADAAGATAAVRRRPHSFKVTKEVSIVSKIRGCWVNVGTAMLLGFVPFSGNAQTTVNFDQDPDGNPILNGSNVETLYQSVGLTFACQSGDSCTMGAEIVVWDVAATVSPPNVVGNSLESSSGCIDSSVIRATFDGFEPDLVSIAAYDENPPGGAFLQAFDANDNLLVEDVRSGITDVVTLTVSAGNIAYVEFNGLDGDTACFDDLTYVKSLTVIDFDEDPDGNPVPNGTNVETLYQNLGVNLACQSGDSCTMGAEIVAWDVTAPTSPPNVVGNSLETSSGCIDSSVIRATFEGLDPTLVSIAAYDDNPPGGAFLRAFDATDKLLDEDVRAAITDVATLQVSAANITYVEFNGLDGDTACFDDLSFVASGVFSDGFESGDTLAWSAATP